MKIKQVIVMLFICLSVIPLTLTGVGNMAYYNHKLVSVLENDLKVAVSTQIKGIENFFAERRTDAAVITGYRQVHELFQAIEENDRPRMRRLREEMDSLLRTRAENSEFVESITLLDRDFVVRACSDAAGYEEVSALKDIDGRYLSRELQFTDVVETGREGSRKKVIAAVQELYEGSRKAGYIVLEINLAFFEDIRVSAPLLDNGTIYLVDNLDQMITAGDSYAPRQEYLLSASEREDYNRAWKGRDKNSRQGILRYKARGERYLSCYSYLDSTDWKIISSINTDEILQTRKGLAELFLLIVIMLLILLAVVNVVISRYIASPVNGMIEKFGRIRETNDYSIRMEPVRSYEIGLVTKGVNSLLDNIEMHIEQEKSEQMKLKEKAEKDAQTGLYNRAALELLLRKALEERGADGGAVACLFLDVDDFKNFNTEYGHRGGDKVLKFVAENLEKYFPGTCGRQGGDEFLAFAAGVSDEALKEKVKGLLADINKGIVLNAGGPEVPIGCSIGAVLAVERDISCRELITQADKVMYLIKHSGKNSSLVLSSKEAETALK